MSEVVQAVTGGASWLIVLVATGLAAAIQHVLSFNGELLRALHSLRAAIWP